MLQRAVGCQYCVFRAGGGGGFEEMRGCIHPSTGSPDSQAPGEKPLVRIWEGGGRTLEHHEPW